MKRTKLSDIASLTVGFVGTMTQHYVDSGIPFLRSLNIKPFYIDNTDLKYISASFSEELSKSILNENDIVIVRTGIPGTCCVVPKEYDGCNCADVVIVHPDFSKVNPYYLAAYINIWGQKQILNNKVGAIQQHFNVHTAEEMLVFLPDKETQDHVANLICSVNEKIQVNERLCAELEAMAKALYDYWFVQFDFPDENGKPYRTSGGAMEWCQELGREVPKGWKAGTVVDLGEIVSGATPSTTEENYYTTNGIAWITPNDLSDNEHNMFVFHGERDITEAGLSSCSAILMPAGSVLMSSRAPIGYLAIAANPVCTNQGFKSIICTKDYGTLFVYYTLKRNVQGIARQGVGTTFKEVSRDTLARYTVLLPDTTIAKHFEQLIAPISQTRKNCEQENRELIALRDWLLPMLMNGQAQVEK